MTHKTLSAVAIGASIVAITAGIATAKPMPADQFHWSSAIDQSGSFKHDGKTYNLEGKLSSEAGAFVAKCASAQEEIRVRGFLTAQGNEDYSKAEFLCGNLKVGGDTPIAYNQGGEVKVFGPIYMTKRNNVLPECQPYSNSTNRVWSNCGVFVPNDTTAKVLVGDGGNTGKELKTAHSGSGVATVQPILAPETETMREKIFRERVASGYYANK